MKILFLDIDGVLNSTRTCVAFGGFPMELDHIAAFDQVAIRLIQRVCDSAGVSIVLSSAWRLHCDWRDAAKAFGLPIISATGNGLGPRGQQIQDWLEKHANLGIERFAIIDDDSDMLPTQIPFFVHTSGHEGVTWADFVKLCELLGASPYEGQPRNRNWQNGGTLDWDEG